MLSNAMTGVVAVQQSRVLGKSERPLGGGKQTQFRPQSRAPPPLLKLGGAVELCCPPRAVSVKKAWFHPL